jgi:hypothetical protein
MLKHEFRLAALGGCMLLWLGCGGDRSDQAAERAPEAGQQAAVQTETSAQDAPMSMPGGHPQLTPSADIDLTGIERADGGKTVAEIWAERQELAGGEVAVRGRVVKFLPSIMGKNWIHLRDGTGEGVTSDLTVTTTATVAVGDLVTVTGRLAVDRDFGAGYRYQVILEDAEVRTD